MRHYVCPRVVFHVLCCDFVEVTLWISGSHQTDGAPIRQMGSDRISTRMTQNGVRLLDFSLGFVIS